MGQVRRLPRSAGGVRLADAVRIYLATITVPNTRATYAAALVRLVADFGADTDVALLGSEPDRVSGWFTFVWGGKSAKTFNIRLTALGSACGYWREQQWLAGDPLVRLRARPAPPDTSKALSRDRVAEILGSDAGLRQRVLWHLLYESSARAEEVLMLDVPDLDIANRCAVVTRKGGAREVIAWQTGTSRLLPRMLAGRRTGPLFLTDRRARPSVARNDVDPVTGRARLSYRRAAELFEAHTDRPPHALPQIVSRVAPAHETHRARTRPRLPHIVRHYVR
ncbi:site-specific integrase [Gordonia amicalis]|uniref:site-specific integrase n=1 Tax=Gordonia amicalis TaxID=89053 RepID=UPI002953EE7F|nr:site-specific integrase [Gordonia amicalis]MDV7102460.1 site-specific integrase [Gordonia amicalis]